MIARIVGKVVEEDAMGHLVVDVRGVGYEVLTPVGTLGRATHAGDEVTLFTHLNVREDAMDLFGFATEAERRVFRLLIEVPNVGPRTAINVLSALPVAELVGAVRAGDVARLTRVPGIGKKTAERLGLELREKMGQLAPEASPQKAPAPRSPASQLLFALTNMGYKSQEAERAVASLGDRVDQEPMADLLREALSRLTP